MTMTAPAGNRSRARTRVRRSRLTPYEQAGQAMESAAAYQAMSDRLAGMGDEVGRVASQILEVEVARLRQSADRHRDDARRLLEQAAGNL